MHLFIQPQDLPGWNGTSQKSKDYIGEPALESITLSLGIESKKFIL